MSVGNPVSASPPVSKAKSRTRLWFLWHSWLAMPIWAFLFFVCLTGSIAVLSHEIMWLSNPAMRATADGPPLPAKALVAAAEAAVPGGRVASLSWGGSHMAVAARLGLPDGTSAIAWVDPASGLVQGVSTGPSFQGFFRALHGWLLTYPVGWYAVSLLGIPLMGSLITGLVVYKRFWRSFYKPRIRWGNGARVMWGDLHRVGGTWSIWFLALMSITGLWFLINTLLWDLGMPLGGVKPPVLVPREDMPVTATAPRPDPDAILESAFAAVPDMRLRSLSLPAVAFVPARVVGSSGQAPLLPDFVQINPLTNEVMEVSGGFDRPAAQLTGTIMRALHTGDFGGLAVKLVWFFFGLLLTGLVFSGMMIWSKRTLQATAEWRRLRAAGETSNA